MSGGTVRPRQDQVEALTRGLRLPLEPIAEEHLEVIAEGLRQAFDEARKHAPGTVYAGDEPEVTALVQAQLNGTMAEDPLWRQLVLWVGRGSESVSFDGKHLEKRPDLSIVLSGAERRFPLVAEAKILGRRRHPGARELFITADAGGSNGYRSRVWKHRLQQFADETRLRVHVGHFPPGTSKWNKIEHRLFCHITQNWRGKPLRTFETVVDLIGNTRTAVGLRVQAGLDAGEYPTGETVTKAEMDALSLHRDDFHGDWNYELRPR